MKQSRGPGWLVFSLQRSRIASLGAAISVALALTFITPGTATAQLDLELLPGRTGCYSLEITSDIRPCTRLRVPSTGASTAATMSPDGRSLYVTFDSYDGVWQHGVVVLRRDPRSGALTQLRGRGTCLTATRLPAACERLRGIASIEGMWVSPDSRSVYLYHDRSLAILRRDRASGRLRQLPGRRGCISEHPTCQRLPLGSRHFFVDGEFSPDGRYVYLVSENIGASLIRFRRDPRDGSLREITGGCLSTPPAPRGCVRFLNMTGDRWLGGIAFSPDGRQLYAAGSWPSSVVAFGRDPATDTLDRMPTAPPCLVSDPCNGVDPGTLHVSADGQSVYALAYELDQSTGLITWDRDVVTGALSNARVWSCGVLGASKSPCSPLKGVTESDDGRLLFLETRRALIVLQRDPTTGLLTRLPWNEGCYTSDPDIRFCRQVRFEGRPIPAPGGRHLYLETGSGLYNLRIETT